MQPKKLIRYLAGWEIDFDDKDAVTSFLQVQGVNKQSFNFFKDVQAALELKMDGYIATEIFKHELDESELIETNVELPLLEWNEHEVFFLEKNLNGHHKIGGSIPNELMMPTHNNLKTKFHYIGTINGLDPKFTWLGLEKLNIIYPLNECNTGIFLDYSEPEKPKILNPETFNDAWYDPELDNFNRVEFLETRYTTIDIKNTDLFIDNDELLICGVPLWYQNPEIPICPKTNEVMKFVCTINSDSEIKLIQNNNSEKVKLVFGDYLCFGDYGHLFVFYNPNSKVLHLNAQW